MGHDAQEFRFDFVGFFQFGGLNFYFLVKLRVVDRNGNLTRERVEKLNLLFVKLVARAILSYGGGPAASGST